MRPPQHRDAHDAFVLANILRTDAPAHRPLPEDSDLVRAIRVLARAQQDAVWDRTTAVLRLRSLLREYYPVFLAALPARPRTVWPRRSHGYCWQQPQTPPRPWH